MLEDLIHLILPPIISALELVGILIVTVGAFRAFFHYVRNLVFQIKFDYKYVLFNAMATGLEFKMAAEILKTVLIRDFNELLILGAVILLRALMTFMIRMEMRDEREERSENPELALDPPEGV